MCRAISQAAACPAETSTRPSPRYCDGPMSRLEDLDEISPLRGLPLLRGRPRPGMGRAPNRPRFMAILLFHRVTDQIPEDGLTVSTARFRASAGMLRPCFPRRPARRGLRHSPIRPRHAAAHRGRHLRRLLPRQPRRRPRPDRTLPARLLLRAHRFRWHGSVFPVGPRPAAAAQPRPGTMSAKWCGWATRSARTPSTTSTWEPLRLRRRGGSCASRRRCWNGNSADRCAGSPIPTGERELPARGGRPGKEAGYDGCLSGYGGFVAPGAATAILPRDSVALLPGHCSTSSCICAAVSTGSTRSNARPSLRSPEEMRVAEPIETAPVPAALAGAGAERPASS